MKLTALTILATVLAFTEYSSAANCYGPGNPGASVSQYQTIASGICNGATFNYQNLNCQSNCCVLLEAGFSGSSGQRSQCWNAYNNIISQCVQNGGRNGGDWQWNSNGVTQNYYIQGHWSCSNTAAAIDGVNSTVVNGTIKET